MHAGQRLPKHFNKGLNECVYLHYMYVSMYIQMIPFLFMNTHYSLQKRNVSTAVFRLENFAANSIYILKDSSLSIAYLII